MKNAQTQTILRQNAKQDKKGTDKESPKNTTTDKHLTIIYFRRDGSLTFSEIIQRAMITTFIFSLSPKPLPRSPPPRTLLSICFPMKIGNNQNRDVPPPVLKLI